jgi:hypothetical protein
LDLNYIEIGSFLFIKEEFCMAVNETIVTGRYFRRCTDAANKVWQRISFWHKASDCEFDDGTTAQTKVGAIKGITTSTSVTETGYAADMTTVKGLQTQIDELNSNLSKNISFTFVATQSGNGQRTLNVSGYKQYLCCDIFYASNDNPLDWGCTTSIGSVDRICSQLSSYCGMSVYLVTTNYTGSVTITMNGHNKNIVNIYGINL